MNHLKRYREGSTMIRYSSDIVRKGMKNGLARSASSFLSECSNNIPFLLLNVELLFYLSCTKVPKVECMSSKNILLPSI